MNIELERKLLYVIIVDRENKIKRIAFQDSSFFANMSFAEAEKNNIKATVYGIENNKKFLIIKDIPLIELRDSYGLRNEIANLKKVKLECIGKNTPKMDLTNFKFNLNWNSIF